MKGTTTPPPLRRRRAAPYLMVKDDALPPPSLAAARVEPMAGLWRRQGGGDHPKEHTWLMFPGSDIFARVPFHVAHTVLEKGAFLNLGL
jgi:hypothetical protein